MLKNCWEARFIQYYSKLLCTTRGIILNLFMLDVVYSYVNVYTGIYRIDELLRDTDSELEDDEPKKKVDKHSKKKKAGSAWLKEGGDEDFVDFLDPTVAQKVLGEFVMSKYIHSISSVIQL